METNRERERERERERKVWSGLTREDEEMREMRKVGWRRKVKEEIVFYSL